MEKIFTKIKNILRKLHPYNDQIEKDLDVLIKELKLKEEYKKTYYSKDTELDVDFDNVEEISAGDLATKIELL